MSKIRNMDKFEAEALKVAAQSTCKKRKVGAILVDIENDIIVASGYNHNLNDDEPCETDGITMPNVVHAEVACIKNFSKAEHENVIDTSRLTMFVTHPPCENCLAEIKKFGCKLHIVGAFMKFDADKLRYDLLPPFALKELARVLTYGAKKYKPNNWKLVDDPHRYTAALYRHIEAWRLGEEFDKESGIHHLSHAATNAIFLVELFAKRRKR